MKFDQEQLLYQNLSSTGHTTLALTKDRGFAIPHDSGKITLQKGEDITIDGNQFFKIPSRALSKTLVTGYWLDYRVGDVLKDSAHLLENQPILVDHFASANNVVGKYKDVKFNNAYGGKPPGLDGVNYIPYNHNYTDQFGKEQKTNELIDKIKSGILESQSVAIEFDWEKSHPEMNDWEFFVENYGSLVGGDRVSLLVTNIIDYSEISIVYRGADPFAKVVMNKALLSKKNNIDQNGGTPTIYSMSNGENNLSNKKKRFSMGDKTDKEDRVIELNARDLANLGEYIKTQTLGLDKDCRYSEQDQRTLTHAIGRDFRRFEQNEIELKKQVEDLTKDRDFYKNHMNQEIENQLSKLAEDHSLKVPEGKRAFNVINAELSSYKKWRGNINLQFQAMLMVEFDNDREAVKSYMAQFVESPDIQLTLKQMEVLEKKQAKPKKPQVSPDSEGDLSGKSTNTEELENKLNSLAN